MTIRYFKIIFVNAKYFYVDNLTNSIVIALKTFFNF